MRSLLGFSLVLAASSASAFNLVTNGDFSSGNVGFTTEYTYNAPATGALNDDSVYTLTNRTRSPYVLNTYGILDYGEHTDGNGLFLAVNGSTSAGKIVWQQTLSGLTVGQSYRFGAWISRWTVTNDAAAKLSVFAGGVEIANFEDPGAGNGAKWVEHTSLFTATTSSLTLQIRNYENSFGGNDFGLDDVSVQAVPEPASMMVLGLGVAAMVRRRTARRI